MRIVAGRLKGLTLAAVGTGDRAAHLRPTSDRLREALFNILAGGTYGDPVPGARVLDLFAGTGALGFEALSRGAARLTLVDDGRKAAALITRNIALTRSAAQCTLIRRDATRLGPWRDAPHGLVFLDPPYGKSRGAGALGAALRGGWLAPGALIVWEESAPQPAPDGFTPLDTRRYGDTHVTFLRAPEADSRDSPEDPC